MKFEGLIKNLVGVMPVPDHVRDDGSGIQNLPEQLDSCVRRNDTLTVKETFCEVYKFKTEKN